jgi:SprT protein
MADLAERVRIAYNGRLRTCLGRAMLAEGRVELNTRMLQEHPGELVHTLVHELAHLVVYRRFGRVPPHGIRFRTLMRAVHLTARATHDLAAKRTRHRRRYLYLHRCGTCGRAFIARRIMRGCYCKVCGPRMAWEIVRAPNNPEGMALLTTGIGGSGE